MTMSSHDSSNGKLKGSENVAGNENGNDAVSGGNDNPSNILQDYSTRYEELLLRQRKVLSAKTTTDQDKHQPCNQMSKVASILSSHAAMRGMLQCAADATKRSMDVNQDAVEGLTCLLEDTAFRQDYDLDEGGVWGVVPGSGMGQETIDPNSKQSNAKRCALGTTCALAALEQQRNFQSLLDSSQLFPQNDGDDFDSDTEVDAFFREHPSCCNEKESSMAYFLECDDDDDDDDDDDGNDNASSKGNEDIVKTMTKGNKIRLERTNEKQPQMRQQMQPTDNPYARKKSNNPASNATTQSWDAYDVRHAQSDLGYQVQDVNRNRYENGNVSMANQPQGGASFRTAREVRQQDSSTNGNDGLHNDPQARHNQSLHQQNNPYNRASCQVESTSQSFNPNRPNLSAGLKRKFQTPKPREGESNHPTTNQRGNCGNANGGGNSTNTRSTNNPNSDEEELPEELKGLDKELISKIENEIVDSGDPITFKEIAGLKDAKQTVLELVCWPMKRPDLFTGLRRGPNGLLLFGPPGTGKTLIGKAIAHESGATFFSISSSSLTSKWIGEGEKLVRTLFAVAAYREPAVVFIDEIDSLLTQRKADENEASRRIKTEFLVQLDGTGTSGQGRVLAIGATNRPHELDDAARRRFVKRLYIPLPKAPDREVLLRTLLLKNKHCLSNKEISKISNDTAGFSGADLKSFCTDAALGPIRQLGARALEIDAKDVPPISYRHFRHALKGMNPSVAQSDLDVYEKWNDLYGSKSVTAEDYDGLSEEEDSE